MQRHRRSTFYLFFKGPAKWQPALIHEILLKDSWIFWKLVIIFIDVFKCTFELVLTSCICKDRRGVTRTFNWIYILEMSTIKTKIFILDNKLHFSKPNCLFVIQWEWITLKLPTHNKLVPAEHITTGMWCMRFSFPLKTRPQNIFSQTRHTQQDC